MSQLGSQVGDGDLHPALVISHQGSLPLWNFTVKAAPIS